MNQIDLEIVTRQLLAGMGGNIGTVAHAAYHLGAIRRKLAVIRRTGG